MDLTFLGVATVLGGFMYRIAKDDPKVMIAIDMGVACLAGISVIAFFTLKLIQHALGATLPGLLKQHIQGATDDSIGKVIKDLAALSQPAGAAIWWAFGLMSLSAFMAWLAKRHIARDAMERYTLTRSSKSP